MHRTYVALHEVTWCMKFAARFKLCISYNHAPCHFMQSRLHKVYACLAVTCHLHFWQNDGDLLRATAVTWGWNGYWNKSQHRKLTLEKKILPPLLQGFEPVTFQSRVQCSNHRAIPAPQGRPRMSDLTLLSAALGLSFYSFPISSLVFLPSSLALSVWSFFC